MDNALNNSSPLPRRGIDFRSQHVLLKCRNLTLLRLSLLLSDVVEHIEPALLYFAYKAESRAVQAVFLDAIPRVKAMFSQADNAFQKKISRGFAEFKNGLPINYPVYNTKPGGTFERLRVNHVELEEEGAVQKMAQAAQRRYAGQLHELRGRMAMIQGRVSLADKDLPGSPAHIVKSYQAAVASLGTENRVLLVLHALFNKFVMNNMGGIYDRCNSLLAYARVLPNLLPESPNTEATNQKLQDVDFRNLYTTPAAVTTWEELGEELFNMINSFRPLRRPTQPVSTKSPDGVCLRQKEGLACLVEETGGIQPLGSTYTHTEVICKEQGSSALDRGCKVIDTPHIQSSNVLEMRAKTIEKKGVKISNTRETFNNARNQVIQAINIRTQGFKLPSVLDCFLRHAWTDKLIFMLLSNPGSLDSAEWKSALLIVDQLLMVTSIDSINRLSSPYHDQVQKLMRRIEEGMSSLGEYYQTEIEDLFRLLLGQEGLGSVTQGIEHYKHFNLKGGADCEARTKPHYII